MIIFVSFCFAPHSVILKELFLTVLNCNHKCYTPVLYFRFPENYSCYHFINRIAESQISNIVSKFTLLARVLDLRFEYSAIQYKARHTFFVNRSRRRKVFKIKPNK